MNLPDWHTRYTLQAGWTRDLRRYLCEKAHLAEAHSVLEVGCGTGAVLASLPELTSATLHGLDIDYSALEFAHTQTPATLVNGQSRLVNSLSRLVNGDAFHLPYAPASFDAVCCHYLLLWLRDPIPALQEMRRVLRPGGSLLVFAEPDYGGRVDYPETLSILREWQSASLRAQGADPRAGRQLSHWLHAAGFTQVVTGLLGGEWSGEFNQAEFDSEWDLLSHDVGQAVQRDHMDELQTIDKHARLAGERILFVPTFYGMGICPCYP